MSGVEVGYGMKFINIEPLTIEVGKKFDYIQTISPIILKSKETNKFLTFNDGKFINELTNRCVKKLQYYDENINLSDFKIEVVSLYGKNKIKRIKVKDFNNKANMVRLKITGNANTRKILYELGIGSSTGSGFGAVKTLTNSYNRDKY